MDFPAARAGGDRAAVPGGAGGAGRSGGGGRSDCRRAIVGLLEEMGVEGLEEGALDLLCGSVCNEAADLLGRAAKLRGPASGARRGPGSDPAGISAADLRVAVELRRGVPRAEWAATTAGAKLRTSATAPGLPVACAYLR